MTATAAPERVRLAIGGMTCASCASRIERRLNRLGGVEATVNFATADASVTFDPTRADLHALIAAVEATGYTATPKDGARATSTEDASAGDANRLRLRLVVGAVLSTPLVALAMIPPTRFDGWEWAALVLSAPVVLWSGWPFHRAAVLNARHRAATMDTLISMGTLAALLWSTVVLVGGLDSGTYFEVGAVITTLILLGRYFEARARRRSGEAIRQLLALGAKEARVLQDGVEISVPIEALNVGDLFVVRPGDKVATDGVVVDGSSALDRSMLTGESVPVEVTAGDDVAGATVNTYGRLVVRASRVGADTALAQIARLVDEAQQGKAPVQRLVDRVSAVFVPVVIALSLATLAGWLFLTGDAEAHSRRPWPC